MAEPQTAEALAEELQTLYCKHWNGAYCEICAVPRIKAYARQQVEAWKEAAVRNILDREFVLKDRPFARWVTKGGSYPKIPPISL